MRVFLRNKKSRLYRAGSDEWAAVPEMALAFTSVPEPARVALDGNWAEMEIVIRYEILPDEVAVPVLPEWRDHAKLGSADVWS